MSVRWSKRQLLCVESHVMRKAQFLSLLTFLICATCLAQPITTTAPFSTSNIVSTTANVTVGATRVELPFQVSDYSGIAFRVIVPVAGATMEIVDPAGAVAITATDGRIQFTSSIRLGANTPGGIFTTSDLPLAINGTWKIRISFPPAITPTFVLASSAARSIYESGIVTDRSQYVTGETAVIGVVATNNGQSITGLSPVVTIANGPNSVATPIVATDDGVAADGKANDGLYSASFKFSTPGSYIVKSTMSIPTSTGVVVRKSEQTIDVVDPSISVASSTLEAVLDSGSTCAVSLGVRMSLNATSAGRYVIRGGLSGSNGKSIAVGETFTLTTGAQSVFLPFPSDTIKEKLGYTLPMTADWIEGYQITQAGESNRAFEKSGIGTYTKSLCRDPITLSNSVATAETLQNTLISALTFSLPINVTLAGSYDITLSVVGPNGEAIESIALTRTLVAGDNQVSFTISGEKFASVNGPYRITGLLVVGGSASASLLEVGRTGPYSASQFVGYVGPLAAQESLPIPTTSPWGLVILALLLYAFAGTSRRTSRREQSRPQLTS